MRTLCRALVWLLVAAPLAWAQEPTGPDAQAAGERPAQGEAPDRAVPRSAAAPTDSRTSDDVFLGEITVTATRMEENLLNVPQSVSVATEGELRRRQAATPGRMLDEVPGVWNHRNGPAGASPILRGQIGPRVLYLYDGIRVNNSALFGGPNAFLNTIPPGAIERIEVLHGPGSLQYGSDAIGGIVNVITRRVPTYPEQGVLYGGRVTTRYGSVDDLLANDSYAWVSSPHLSLLAGGGFSDAKHYDGGGDFGEVKDTAYETEGFYTRLGWKPGKQHLVEASFQRFGRNDVYRYTQSKNNPSRIPTLFDPAEERDLAKLSYRGRDLGAALDSFDAWSYLQQFDSLGFRTAESSTRFDRRETTRDQSVYGAGFQGVTPVRVGREHKLVWGGDYRLEKIGSSLRLRRTTKATGAVVVSEPAGQTPDGSYEVYDAFALAEISLRENLTLTAGIRYEATHLDSAPRPIDAVTPFTLNDLDLDEWWHSVTWSAGAVWWFTEEAALAGSVGTGFRAPNFSDAISFGVPTQVTGVSTIPSPGVQPEEAIQYELGPRYAGERLTAAVSAYYLDLDPTIVPVGAGAFDVPGVGTTQARQNQTIGTAFVRGVEGSLAYRPVDGLTLFGNLTYTFGRDKFLDAPLRFIPPLNGLLGVRYERTEPRPWWIEATVRMVDRYTRHAPDDETDVAYAVDPGFNLSAANPALRAGFEMPGYAVVGLRGGVELVRRENLAGRLVVSIENLLDKEYREVHSRQVVEPGVNVVTGIEIDF
ncbi:MAG: TonB-dependent receptor [Planctomycetes bacterium]|nr:TonB-dependent receptor [Planctomycetota bacterium]